MGKYPVISIFLKSAKQMNVEEAYARLAVSVRLQGARVFYVVGKMTWIRYTLPWSYRMRKSAVYTVLPCRVMTMNYTERITEKLKELIDENGLDYLMDKPYEVYKELMGAEPEAAVTAGAILMLLASGVWDSARRIRDNGDLSKKIQKECCFNKRMSDQLTDIIQSLYSKGNKTEWRSKCNEGLTQFLGQDHVFEWEGFSVWDAGNCTVDCYYNAEIVLRPTESAARNKDLYKLLKKNPFMTRDAIYQFYEKGLKQYLDSEFEEYCTCDDYYQPVVEDYELEYDVSDWCEKNGFEVISCEGDGSDGGYDPKFTRRW